LRPSILFLPDPDEALRHELDSLGVSSVSASLPESANEVDIVLIDPKRIGQEVAVLRRNFEHTHPGVPVVVMGDAGLESAIAAMRAGAADYVEVSAPAGEIAAIARRLVSERAIVSSLSTHHATSAVPELVGKSAKLRERRAARHLRRDRAHLR
jgi:DNA-binding NtrC family response regulator